MGQISSDNCCAMVDELDEYFDSAHISLDIKPYCNGCAYFEPEKSAVIYADNRSCVVKVMCENKRKCDRIEAYLRREMEKEDNSSYEN